MTPPIPLICQMRLLSVYIKRSFNFDNPLLLITSCLCVVPRITLPGITLADAAYRPFSPVANSLLSKIVTTLLHFLFVLL